MYLNKKRCNCKFVENKDYAACRKSAVNVLVAKTYKLNFYWVFSHMHLHMQMQVLKTVFSYTPHYMNYGYSRHSTHGCQLYIRSS
jgi:hypothetical protein